MRQRKTTTSLMLINGLVLGTTIVWGPLSVQAAEETSDTEAVTVSEISMIETTLDPDYVDTPQVFQEDGALQQAEAIEQGETVATEQRSADYIARADLNSQVALVGVTWDSQAVAPSRVLIRSLAVGIWSEWSELEFAGEQEGDAVSVGTEPYLVTNAGAIEVVAYSEDGAPIPDILLNVIDPQAQAEVSNALEDVALPEEESSALDGAYQGETASYSAAVFAASSGVPAISLDSSGTQYATWINGLVINTRKAWAANEGWNTAWVETINVQGAVIHHTAGTNNYSKSDVPGIIRGIYYYHAVSLDWGDIGYNLIVDKYGGVWEGRAGGLTRGVKGAHAYGANSQTFGITVLGDYTSTVPTAAAQDSVAKAVAWKLGVHGITSANGNIWVNGSDFKGRTVALVSGHRDIGGTSCPGQSFYNLFPSIRNKINGYIVQTEVSRVAGEDRYGTSRAVNERFGSQGGAMFVTSGGVYADTLSAAPAAALVGGNLVLSQSDRLNNDTIAAIRKANPTKIYVIGGTNSISPEVEESLKQYAPVDRIGGADRYETSRDIFTSFFQDTKYAYVANGGNYADALVSAAAAGALKAPVLLVKGQASTSLDSQLRNEMQTRGVTTVYIAGGSASVTQQLEQDAKSYFSVSRQSGANRYETAVAINATIKSTSVFKHIWVATGTDFPDALSAAVPAAKAGEPVYLVSSSCVPLVANSAIMQMGYGERVVTGGTKTISDDVKRLSGKTC